MILSDSIIWWQCIEKRWQCIKVHLVTEHGLYVDMHKVEVILRVGRGGWRVRQRGGGWSEAEGEGGLESEAEGGGL